MADEAVLRIVLQDGGGQPTSAVSAPSASVPVPVSAGNTPVPSLAQPISTSVPTPTIQPIHPSARPVPVSPAQPISTDAALRAAGSAGGTGGSIASGISTMMGAGAAAVPPIAIAMAVKEIVDKINREIVGAIKTGIGTASAVMQGIASADSDPSKPIAAFGDATSKAGEKIANEVSPALGYLAVAAGEATKSFAVLMQELDKTAQRYGEYSPQIAQAQAIAEIRHTMGDLRRAQEAGPELARYVQAQSEMQQKFEDIKIKLLMRILPGITRILEVLEMVIPSGQGIEAAITALSAPLAAIPGAAALIAQTMQDQNRPPVDDPTSQLFDPQFNTLQPNGGWVPNL